MQQKFITKCVTYYRVRQVLQSVEEVYYKVGKLLKSGASFTKWVNYYCKLHLVLSVTGC